MPNYDFRCEVCGQEREEFCKNLSNGPKCCGESMKWKPSFRVYGVSGYPYLDPVLEREITGPLHKKRVLEELGLVERN